MQDRWYWIPLLRENLPSVALQAASACPIQLCCTTGVTIGTSVLIVLLLFFFLTFCSSKFRLPFGTMIFPCPSWVRRDPWTTSKLRKFLSVQTTDHCQEIDWVSQDIQTFFLLHTQGGRREQADRVKVLSLMQEKASLPLSYSQHQQVSLTNSFAIHYSHAQQAENTWHSANDGTVLMMTASSWEDNYFHWLPYIFTVFMKVFLFLKLVLQRKKITKLS